MSDNASLSLAFRRPSDFVWVIWFCLCLVPLNLPGGISANYLFCFTPLIAFANGDSLRFPPASLTCLGLFYFAIYAAGMLGLAGVQDHALWRTASFLIFSSMFVFCVIRVTPAMIGAFMWAVVVISIAFSAEMIFRYYLVGVLLHYSELARIPVGFSHKEFIGTQRMSFLFSVAYCLLVHAVFVARGFYHRLAASVGLGVVYSGLLLTFSRTAVLALMSSIALFVVWRVIQHFREGPTGVRASIQALAPVVLAHLAALAIFPETVRFYADRVIGFTFSGQIFVNVGAIAPDAPLTYDVGETSEGTRMRIWRAILEHVDQNPLLGTGFMGTWSVSEFGSAHNQYMDVLLRTGYVGALAYIALLAILTVHLYRVSKPLFFGMVAALVAGLFHETFKESHGGFLLAFFIGMYVSRNLGAEPSRDDRIVPELLARLRKRAQPA